jgi:TonB family protein
MPKFSIAVLLIFVPFQFVFAQGEKQVEIFDAPKMKEMTQPHYPLIESNREREGWVVVNYMVDTTGAVFEPSVVASTGSKNFEEAALKAISESKFEPASLGDKSVEGSGIIRYTFTMEKDQAGATRQFGNLYKRLTKALEKSDKEEADEIIAKIEERVSMNHYERAYYDFAQSMYAQQFGTKREQMNYLRSALQYESDYDNGDEFLPAELVLLARKQLFALEVENRRFAEALRTYTLIKRKYDGEATEIFDKTAKQVYDLRTDDSVYAVESVFNDNGYFSIGLHKRGFYVEPSDTLINEFKLRCQKKYVFFAYEQGKQYKIPDTWGPCSLQVLGEANGEFELVQF